MLIAGSFSRCRSFRVLHLFVSNKNRRKSTGPRGKTIYRDFSCKAPPSESVPTNVVLGVVSRTAWSSRRSPRDVQRLMASVVRKVAKAGGLGLQVDSVLC